MSEVHLFLLIAFSLTYISDISNVMLRRSLIQFSGLHRNSKYGGTLKLWKLPTLRHISVDATQIQDMKGALGLPVWEQAVGNLTNLGFSTHQVITIVASI